MPSVTFSFYVSNCHVSCIINDVLKSFTVRFIRFTCAPNLGEFSVFSRSFPSRLSTLSIATELEFNLILINYSTVDN